MCGPSLHTRLFSSSAACWPGLHVVYGAAAKKRPVLSVRPSSGVLAAHSRLTLTAIFAPRLEAPLNASVLCNVRRMSRPLALNVKGEGCALRDSMQVRICERMEPSAEKVNEWCCSTQMCAHQTQGMCCTRVLNPCCYELAENHTQ